MTSLIIGESLIDAVTRPDGTESRHPGGSPFNVAVGLSRLGRHVRLLTRIGKDADGELLLDHLHDSNVELTPGSVVDGPTSVAHATLNASGSANYHFDITTSFPRPPQDETLRAELIDNAPRAVHIGSIGAHLEPGASAAREWVEFYHGHSAITYDPNVRLSITGSAAQIVSDIESLMPFVDVVKASDEDIHQLFGHTNPNKAAQYFLDRGAHLAVITMGAEGVYLSTHSTEARVPAAKVDVVDTVGAGDALMAALIDGLGRFSVLGGAEADDLDGLSFAQLSSLGSYVAAAAGIAVTRAGANPPTRDELTLQSDLYTSPR